jgi:hypothetical protein
VRKTATLLALCLLAACGAGNETQPIEPAPTEQTTGTTEQTPETVEQSTGETVTTDAVSALVDSASANGFDCRIGDVTVARLGTNSLYRSVDANGQGLEILTVDWVSYARYTGDIEMDASEERKAIVAELAGNWGSWGQPDTITLEELPVDPTGCLEWVGFDWSLLENPRSSGTEITAGVSTEGEAGARFTEYNGTGAGVRIDIENGTATRLRIETGDAMIIDIRLGGKAAGDAGVPAEGSSAPEHREISQEEYFALVGG